MAQFFSGVMRSIMIVVVLVLCVEVAGSIAFVSGPSSVAFTPVLRSPPPTLRAPTKFATPTTRSAHGRLSMSIDAVPAILLSEEIFGQVAAGGLGIIASGVIGALIVGQLVNLDELEKEWGDVNIVQNAADEPSEEAEDEEEYDEGDNVVAAVKKD